VPRGGLVTRRSIERVVIEVRTEIAAVCQQMADKHGEPPLAEQGLRNELSTVCSTAERMNLWVVRSPTYDSFVEASGGRIGDDHFYKNSYSFHRTCPTAQTSALAKR
jgi:hypothetical protein